jgi:RNA polymerase sigma-70 factor (ECF subfamily)
VTEPIALSEERLRIEAAQKDPARFAPLYDEHFERVYAFVARRVRNRPHAQDLTAEVFEQVLVALPRYEWRGKPFAAWLYRIAGNAVADHFSRAARERSAPLPDPAEPAEEEIAAAERRAMLFRLVRQLPADQRTVIEGRFAKERSIREIAMEMGRSEGAIKQLQWRALQTLRQKLGPHV